MARTNSDRVERLLNRPWSRELVADEGVIAARVPELPGCFAEGATDQEALTNLRDALASWLSEALAKGNEIPTPQGEVQPEEFSGRFSVRVPRSLHRRLSVRADAEGCSLNQLATMLLTAGVEGRATRVPATGTDAYEDITADAVAGGIESIGAMKGIASFLRNRGDINLACLVYSYAAERIAAGRGGVQEAAKEFGKAASLARGERRIRLAESLLQQSLGRDPTNIRSRSALGQLLHHQGRYEEAIDFLEQVADVDDYARLFLGWSRLNLGLSDDRVELVEAGLAEVSAALKRWCNHALPKDRSPWLRQVRRLHVLGPRFADEINQLISFANSNANWPRISPNEVEEASKVDDDEIDAPTDVNLEAG